MVRLSSDRSPRQGYDETQEKCPRDAGRASRKASRVVVMLAGQDGWVVDEFSCGDHQEVRPGVRQGVEEGQGPAADGGRRGDWLVTGQRTPAAWPGPRPVSGGHRPRPPKYPADARAVLRRVWVASGGLCGKYLAAMEALLAATLETHGELVDGKQGYSLEVPRELLGMSAATIDRYLADARQADRSWGRATVDRPQLRAGLEYVRVGDGHRDLLGPSGVHPLRSDTDARVRRGGIRVASV